MNEIIEEKIKLLPPSPGVYKMFNAAGEVIYVGKAVNLKNRVTQYFRSHTNHSAKVIAMVRQIADFEYIRVSNETEALSLESNLIKQFRPYYNILLKDDKHFPYIRIDTKQNYPRIEVVRKVRKDHARYLGPFLSAITLRDSIEIVREFYPVRHCKKDIDRAIARRERPCLMHHIGKCCAPCSGNVTREAYHRMIDEICSFLEGRTDSVLKTLRADMDAAAETLDFEKAATLRDRIRAIEGLSEKQAVIATSHSVADVFALGRLESAAVVFALFVRNGKVVGTERFRMDASSDETDAAILSAFLTQYYAEAPSIVPEILLFQNADDAETIELWLSSLAKRRVTLHVPQRGEKRRLVEIAYRNCLDTLEKDASLQKRAWERGEGAVTQLAGILGLETVPARLECYDNSHLMGTFTVSSMVVFTDGQPSKSAYRRFRIQGDTAGDDLLAMKEVLSRRFQRALDGDEGFLPLPDLIIIDGGRTQLDAATEVLCDLSLDYIPTIGLAESNETIYLPGSPVPISLPDSSAPLHLIERIRDEAHRFAISYHRGLRQKNALFSVLDNVQGIGDKRKRALFDAFITLDAIKAATVDELTSVKGMDRPSAERLKAYFEQTGSSAASDKE